MPAVLAMLPTPLATAPTPLATPLPTAAIAGAISSMLPQSQPLQSGAHLHGPSPQHGQPSSSSRSLKAIITSGTKSGLSITYLPNFRSFATCARCFIKSLSSSKVAPMSRTFLAINVSSMASSATMGSRSVLSTMPNPTFSPFLGTTLPLISAILVSAVGIPASWIKSIIAASYAISSSDTETSSPAYVVTPAELVAPPMAVGGSISMLSSSDTP